MIGLDFETFCEVDIKAHGLARYLEHPSFTPLLGSVRFPSGNKVTYDFVRDPNAGKLLREVLRKEIKISAYNASFERGVCNRLGWNIPSESFTDSAAAARAAGAGSHLAVAAPQLLGMDKVELGADLIRVFSIPTKANGGKPYTKDQLEADPDLLRKWEQFAEYCEVDADLSYELSGQFKPTARERWYEILTQEMNDVGWYVDMPLVHEMQQQYERNVIELTEQFRAKYDPQGKLNMRSYTQLKKWCLERGVKAKSFDKESVPKLRKAVWKRIDATPIHDPKHQQYVEVLALLRLKDEMGGSSLSKLQTIEKMVCADRRLRGQYMHIGAGQTYRTSGRGVQMQNLPRLPDTLGDVEELNEDTVWSNDQLAENLRQVFMAEHPDGQLVVGDFAAVESRGLAYLAGEDWKLDAYRGGKDIYKVLATTFSSNGGVAYEDVTKEQRRGGKVGELACGYGAGGGAVKSFAEKMGIEMEDDESLQIVRDWRGANSLIVSLWNTLDDMMHKALRSRSSLQRHYLPDGGYIEITTINTPDSLTKQHPGAQSIELRVVDRLGARWLTRVFHGCYYRGKDVCYYKASDLRSGDLWRARMTTPPHAWYKLYGGKLAGILTQSFCREMFFYSLDKLNGQLSGVPNIKIIGQFHDELVVEWWPDTARGSIALSTLEGIMANAMSDHGPWSGFPLVADIKYGHRYIK